MFSHRIINAHNSLRNLCYDMIAVYNKHHGPYMLHGSYLYSPLRMTSTKKADMRNPKKLILTRKILYEHPPCSRMFTRTVCRCGSLRYMQTLTLLAIMYWCSEFIPKCKIYQRTKMFVGILFRSIEQDILQFYEMENSPTP